MALKTDNKRENNGSKNEGVKELDQSEPADFEKAISATNYGIFNYLLLAVAVPSCFSTVYETSTMSYILPSAECDLKLTLMHKGVLNAITYAGMITSAFFWGYLADTSGRKKILVFGYIMDFVCVICGSVSQNVYVLMFFKYLGGFLVCGPFAVLMAYMTEFHGSKHRSIVMMTLGLFFQIATLVLTLIAWGILSQAWEFEIIPNYFDIHPWQIFLMVCSIPSLISGTAIIFLPESPKFLISQGRNDEAMKVFKRIFALNTGKPEDEYPVKELLVECTPKVSDLESNPKSTSEVNSGESTVQKSIFTSIRAGLRQLKPMFMKPYLGHSLHVYSIQFCILLGLNTIRLWLPQLFTSIADFESNLEMMKEAGSADLCTVLEYSVNKTQISLQSTSEECSAIIPEEMYHNTIISGVSGLIGYFLAGSLINALGDKQLLVIGVSISTLSGTLLYWSFSSTFTVVLSSIYVTLASISSTALLGVTVNLFPTSMRTMIVSLTMMFGRMGALIGNVLFPFFISLGCFPPFILVASVMLISGILGILLPKTYKGPLK